MANSQVINLYERDISERRTSIGALAGLIAHLSKTSAQVGLPDLLSQYWGMEYRGPSDPEPLLWNALEEAKKELSLENDNGIPSDTLTLWFKVNFERSLIMVRAYQDALSFYKLDMSRKEFSHLHGKLFSFAICDKMEDYLKWETAYLLATVLRSETPLNPDFLSWNHTPGSLFSCGLQRKVWMRICHRARKQDVSLALSIYKCKMVSAPLMPHAVNRAMDKNLGLLTQEHTCVDADGVEVVNEDCEHCGRLEELEYQVRRTVRELFTMALERDWKPSRSWRTPSFNACYDTSRSKGGAYRSLAEKLWPDHYSPLGFPFFCGYAQYKTRITPLYLAEDPEVVEQLLTSELGRSAGRVPVRREPILEPFKVRIVSAGDSIPYQISRSYQRSLWSMIQGSPVCRLVGEPLRSDSIYDLFGIPRMTNIHSVMVSGDYESATDGLNPELSLAALSEYCRLAKVPLEDQIVLSNCLVGHRIDDTYSDGPRDQTWGQLMGSPISFPILTMVNLAVTRFVQERAYQMFIPFSWSSLLVNGDDVLFPLPPAAYPDWCLWTSSAGLKPSVGKNYISREYAFANSSMWKLPLDWDRFGTSMPERVPQINLGLIRNVSGPYQYDILTATSKADEPYGAFDLAGMVEESIKAWDPETSDKIVSRCLHYANSLLQKLPPISWFTHRDHGGLGIPTTRTGVIANHHLRIAALLRTNNDTKTSREHLRLLTASRSLYYYNELVEESYDEIMFQLSVPLERKPRTDLDLPVGDQLRSTLLRGWLVTQGWSHGLRPETDYIKAWFRSYWKWTKLCYKSGSYLKPMNSDRARSSCPWTWEYEGKPLSSTGSHTIGRSPVQQGRKVAPKASNACSVLPIPCDCAYCCLDPKTYSGDQGSSTEFTDPVKL